MTAVRSGRIRRLVVLAGWFLAGAVLLAVVAIIASREVRFVIRASYEEARILLARKPIVDILADSSLSANRRAQLDVVLEARAYAADVLGLRAGDTYTTFAEVRRDTLLLVLTASRWDTLAAHTWRYPVVGTVPYKGFFDFEDGKAAAARLAANGYDVYLRPSPAFSTLGWFNDPLLSTALARDRTMLVELVIHEIAHNTLYVPSATSFNESFAQFVGYRGAEAFFRDRGDATAAARIRAIWRDQGRLAAFYTELVDTLETLYGAALPVRTLRETRTTVFDAAKARLASDLDGTLEVFDGTRLADRPMNNASLVGARLYLSDIGVFDRVLGRYGGDLRAAVHVIAEGVAARGDRPPEAVVEALSVP